MGLTPAVLLASACTSLTEGPPDCDGSAECALTCDAASCVTPGESGGAPTGLGGAGGLGGGGAAGIGAGGLQVGSPAAGGSIGGAPPCPDCGASPSGSAGLGGASAGLGGASAAGGATGTGGSIGSGGSGGCDAGTSECPVACNGCTILDVCQAAGTPNPENPCEICDPARETHGWSARDGAPCDDGLFCTVDDTCAAGACAGAPRACDDGVACNGIETCSEVSSSCESGNNQCGVQEVCDSALGRCVSTCAGCVIDSTCYANGAVQAGNACFGCDPARSKTSWSPRTGSSCGAGSSECSRQDTCDATGTCQPNHEPFGTPCGALAATCSDRDTCDGTGTCRPNHHAAGTPCGAGPTACSAQDTCNGAGSCQPNHFSTATQCGSAGQCEKTDHCDGFGACRDEGYSAPGTACNDGNACTTNDTCNGAGTCQGQAGGCTPTDHVIFVSSFQLLGTAVKSLANADSLCDAAGKAGTKTAALGRNWIALMSDSSAGVHAKNRTTWISGPVRNVQGQTLVSNAAAWPWGALAFPVGYDENGTDLREQVYGNKTWTGTNADGTATGVDCQDASGNSWNGTSTNGTQGRGYATEVTNGWLNGGGIDSCTANVRLYCISK